MFGFQIIDTVIEGDQDEPFIEIDDLDGAADGDVMPQLPADDRHFLSLLHDSIR